MKINGENPFKNSPNPELELVRSSINSLSGCIIKIGENLCRVSKDGYGNSVEIETIKPVAIMTKEEFIDVLDFFKEK